MKKKQRDDLIQWRRAQVIQLRSKGKNLTQIAQILKVDLSTISRDHNYIEENARTILQDIVEKLPLEFIKSLARLNAVSDEAWIMAEKATSDKSKIAALSLAQQAALNIIRLLKDDKIMIETVLGSSYNADSSLFAGSKTLGEKEGNEDSNEKAFHGDSIF